MKLKHPEQETNSECHPAGHLVTGALVDAVDRVFCDSQSHRCPRVAAWQSMGFQCMLKEVIENIEGGGSWGQNCLFLVLASAAAEHACVCLAPV